MNKYFYLVFVVVLLATLGACSGEISTGSELTPELTDGSDAGEESTPTGSSGPVDVICPEESPHPIAEDIAGTFEVSYEQVDAWFCSGIPFDEILLALQTQKITDIEVEQLFDERMQGKTWDEIWNDLGITTP